MWRVHTKFLGIGIAIGLILFIGQTIYADQLISVSGSVSPQASDFQLNATANPRDAFHQGDVVTYTITYGSHLAYADNITIEAQWDEGTLSDQASPTVDLMEYMPGSATEAYASNSATVDLVNRTIQWSVPAFPANTTNQTVQFAIKLRDVYQGPTLVRFPLKIRIVAPDFTTDYQNLILNYLFDSVHFTPPPKFIPTPTPTPVPPPLVFTNISFAGISTEFFKFDAITSHPTKLKIMYGVSPDALTTITSDPTVTYQHIITVSNLTPNTKYYVRFVATDANGVSTTSDRYRFTTAKKGDQPQIDPSSITFLSSDMLLFSPKLTTPTTAPLPGIVIPQNTAYTFRFQVNKPEEVTKVQAIIRNKNVLGITSSDAAEPDTLITDLLQTEQGIFEGRLLSPAIPGAYEEFVRIYDTNGNIIEHALANIHVTRPLSVLNKDTQNPIEGAQISLSYFDELHKKFVPLPKELFSIKNLLYTDYNGQIILPLPAGQYKAAVTALGYKPTIVTFTIDSQENHDFPTVLLTPEAFNLHTVATYYLNSASDLLVNTKLFIQGISLSHHFFDLNAALATALLVILTLVAFTRRIRIPITSLFHYFHHTARVAMKKMLTNQVKGQVVDKQTGNPIVNAHIYLLNHAKGTIVSHTLSTKTGAFLFSTLPAQTYDLQVMADGFEPISSENVQNEKSYLFSLEKRQTPLSLPQRISIFIEKLLALCFEMLLIVSFVFEISLGFSLGFEKTLPFLLFSTFNLFLWVLHMTHLRAQK